MSAGERVALFSGGGNRSNTNASKALVEFRAGNCIYINPKKFENFLENKETGLKDLYYVFQLEYVTQV